MPKHTRRRWFIAFFALLLAGLAGLAFHRAILTAAGEWIVADDPPQKADAAVVLSGESGDGLRTRVAVDLYKHGWVKKVVLSGARSTFRHYETDFSAPLALSLGVPVADLMVITHRARSTQEEAEIVTQEMQRAGMHSLIVVTSNFHTQRARGIFRKVCGDKMRVTAKAAEDDWFAPDSWWQNREGRKTFLLEVTKRFAVMVGGG